MEIVENHDRFRSEGTRHIEGEGEQYLHHYWSALKTESRPRLVENDWKSESIAKI